MNLIKEIADILKIKETQVKSTLELLEQGNTVPFIARYRKEVTGSLDEEEIRYIEERYKYLVNLNKRKEDVIRLIDQQGKLTEEITKAINACLKLSEVEDIYRPYQQKRKTRATEAIASGLQPLADYLLSLPHKGDLNIEASKYLNEKITDVDSALQGARDIIAQIVGDDYKLKAKIQESIFHFGKLICKKNPKVEDEKQVYKMYYDKTEPVKYLANHRIMAIDRGEKEKVLNVSFTYDKEYLIKYALRGITKNKDTYVLDQLTLAVNDGLKRLGFSSVENLVRNELSEKAHEGSIDVFSMNLEKLLSSPPMDNKTILGLDPAFRTGCKLALIDGTGKLLKIETIYPHPPVNKKAESKEKLLKILKDYNVDIVAIGNGTASRESESFVAELIKGNNLNVKYTVISEAGASVYSASKLAQQEFPDFQVEQRSAVSIARRLLDPLAELIKVDPKSIGVGQYQHDLPQKRLSERLDFAVEKIVNRVGIDLNTASAQLLKYCSGLSNSIAQSIVDYREKTGKFNNREELLKVPKLGAKAYYQAVGFLKIKDGINQLDNTFIHPENYEIVKKMIENENITIGKENNIDIEKLSEKYNIDNFTLNDILEDLAKPNRDYRDEFSGPMLRSNILTIDDLKIGDNLEGVVRNVVDFGAFIDIGLKDDGLVHISKMSKEKIKHPSDILGIGDIIEVYIDAIDYDRKKVQLRLQAD